MNLFTQDDTPASLNRVDCTHYPIGHMIYSWLVGNGYHVENEGDRLYLVRSL